MRKLKFNNARKQVRVTHNNGKFTKVKGSKLEDFIAHQTFDKHESTFLNKGGMTYMISNPKSDADDEIFFPIELQYQGTPEQYRLFLGKSNEEIEEIIKIKEEYDVK